MPLSPWYKVVYPREDLREGKPLDAAEFAVHLDQVRDGRANPDYQDPSQFFEKTYVTKSLLSVAAEAVRRLSGIKTESSAVFNMATQFGGGKTHALTLLYHLAHAGENAKGWPGVRSILERAEVHEVPQAAVGVFVGTEFDSITGRGGKDGTPLRRTPWGELAWQLGGAEGFSYVSKHDEQLIAPSSEVIRSFLPKTRPCLILMDELMNYASRNRKSGLAGQLYSFVQNLSEEARSRDETVVMVSIPASELEMTADDQADYDRLKKLLDRVGKAVIMSAEADAAEIIRRRLFEWEGITREAEKTINTFADWTVESRTQIPGWFPVDNARDAFRAAYPFHPVVLSVFERKWQQLPRFQRTRGVLRLMALWVSKAYSEGFKGAHRDPLIGLGTAPLDDPFFRTAALEQLGESTLEGAITTDICGKQDSHAERLDRESIAEIKKARLHRKAATTVFFESNGGQMRAEATVPEVRLAVGEPDLDIGHVETVLEGLADACYYLRTERNRYRFSPTENLNKRFSDRRATISGKDIEDRVRTEVEKCFPKSPGIECIFFPEESGRIPDRPTITLAVLSPNHAMDEEATTRSLARSMTWEHGRAGRTFKSAIIWCVADSSHVLREEARKVLAWEAIDAEKGELHIDESQKRELEESVRRARRDVRESVWRSYRFLLFLGKDNELERVDMGQLNSSQAATLVDAILQRLRERGIIEKDVSPSFLLRNWPGFPDWTTRAVRDAFFASPQFPRLLRPDAVKEAIARGVSQGLLAYGSRLPDGRYDPLVFQRELTPLEVEISDEVAILTAEEAKKHIEPPQLTSLSITPQDVHVKPEGRVGFCISGMDQHGRPMPLDDVMWSASGGTIDEAGVFKADKPEGECLIEATVGSITAKTSAIITKGDTPPPRRQPMTMRWAGEVPHQKWMNFYTKVLVNFVTRGKVKLNVSLEVSAEDGLTEDRVEETRAALRELGLEDELDTR